MKTAIRIMCGLGVALSIAALWAWGSPCNLISLVYVAAVWTFAEIQMHP